MKIYKIASGLSIVSLMLGLIVIAPSVAAADGIVYRASNVLGQTDGSGNPVFNTNVADNGSGTPNAIGFGGESTVVVDTDLHRLYVGNGNCGVSVFKLNSKNDLIDHTADYILGQADFGTPDCSANQNRLTNDIDQIAIDQAHSLLYVADENNSRVMVFDIRNPNSSARTLCGTTTHGVATGMNASCVLGQPDFTSYDSGTNQNQFMGSIEGIAVDPEHNRLYVSDWYSSSRILVFDVRLTDHTDLTMCGTTTNGLTNGMNASCVIGQADFSVDITQPQTASQNSFSSGGRLAYDSSSQLLFGVDWNRVLVFDARDPASPDKILCSTTTNGIATGMNASCVLGQIDFTSTDDPVTVDDKTFNGEVAIGVDPVDELLFLSDSNSHRILAFDISNLANDMSAFSLLGQPNFTTAISYVASQTQIDEPYGGMAYDETNNRLYVDDNNRVMVYDFVNLSSDSLDSATINRSYSQPIATTGSQGTVTFALASGSLPDGLGLDTSTGVLSGKPSKTGTYNFTITATDDVDSIDFGAFSDSQGYMIKVKSASSGGGGSSSLPISSTPPTTPSVVTPPANYGNSGLGDGNVVKDANNPTIYLLVNGSKEPFSSWGDFVGLGYDPSQIKIQDTSAFPLGTTVVKNQRHSKGAVVLINGTVYFLGDTLKYPFPSEAIFKSWGHDFSQVVKANSFDLALPDGPAVEFYQ